jgi:hypothetical protein
MIRKPLLLSLVLLTRGAWATDVDAARAELLGLAPIVRLPITTDVLKDPANSDFPEAARYLSDSAFRLLVVDPMRNRFVPAVGNVAVFGGSKLLPDDHGLTEAEMLEKTAGLTLRLPCLKPLRCFLQYAGGYYWLTTFDSAGNFQDAALASVDRTRFGRTDGIAQSVRIESFFNAYASRSTAAGENGSLPASALDFDRNGFFCSTLYARAATPGETLTYRISQVLPSGKIETVFEADAPYGDPTAACKMQRDTYESAIKRVRK